MHAVIGTRRLTVGMFGALALALSLVLMAPSAAGATEAGPGTDYLACRDEAWADYNTCLMRDPDDAMTRAACYLAWDLDNTGCTRSLLFALTLKGLFS